MRRGKPTRLGAVLLMIIAAVVLVSGLIWAGQTLFSNGQTTSEDKLSAGQKLLNDPTDTTAVRMSVRGPIVAKENHYSIVIHLSQTERTITTFRGYDGEVIASQTLGNTKAAFSDLLAAFNRAGLMTETPGGGTENQGICAVGQLIFFEILKDGQSVGKLWTTSCTDLTGNFGGLVINVQELFLNQIPNSRDIIDAAKEAVE
ncbi:MAG: hypothetical protein ACM3JF_00880 [Sphaerimonospora mesophila]